MRILFLSNYYPPFSLGGYELWCQEVAEALAERGHQVEVITSRVRGKIETTSHNGIPVHRILHPEVGPGLVHTILRLALTRNQVEAENHRQVKELTARFRPDAAMIWGMWNIDRGVPALVEALLPGRTAYYLCDYWLTLPSAYIQRWQEFSRRRAAGLPKRMLGRFFLKSLEKETLPRLKLEHPICVSQAVRNKLAAAGVPVSHARIIYGGVKLEEFAGLRPETGLPDDPCLRLVFIGRLVADKGVHTAIRALGLVHRQGNLPVSLDIYGRGDPDYETQLAGLVRQERLEGKVAFRGTVPRSEIPGLLAKYDGLIFPSEWEEPFARTVLEALAAGLFVIGTTTGGSGEILQDRVTGLTFAAGDPQALAGQIQTALNDPGLRQALVRAGTACLSGSFLFSQMVGEIENKLREIGQNANP